MRLGGPIYDFEGPDEWVRIARERGYRAVECPVGVDASDDEVSVFVKAAADADLVIAEVGAWSNPLASDDATRKAALEKCVRGLELADRVGARCCVNIAGSRGDQWDGPHPANLDDDTFAMIVETTQGIIDAVKPKRAFYSLETMPWVLPDSPESYLRLLKAIDRPQFGVHLDPVNMISSPARFYKNGDFIRECFRLLGPHIKSCHAKDIALAGKLTVHLDEVLPGTGALDYATFLRELDKLDADTTLMIEHLKYPDEYLVAADYIRSVAKQENISL